MTADAPGALNHDGTYVNVKWVVRGRDLTGLMPDVYIGSLMGETTRFDKLYDAIGVSIEFAMKSQPGTMIDYWPVARVPYRRGETRP